jgi:hypothetical protein
MEAVFPPSALGNLVTGTLALCRSMLQSRWRNGPIIVATVVVLFQLVAFHWLVSDMVRTSELRLKATALHDKARWGCNALIGRSSRETCLLQLAELLAKNTL